MAQVAEKTDRAHFDADIEDLKTQAAPEWLKAIREEGAARFSETPFPTYKEEAWRYTNLAPILGTPFKTRLGEPGRTVTSNEVMPYLYGEKSWTQLVFIDGFFSPELSRGSEMGEGVELGGLADAIADGNEVVINHLDKFVAPESAFIALNSALLQDGAYFHLPKGASQSTPVHFLFVSTGAEVLASHPRNLIIVGESAEATVLETYVGLTGAQEYFTNAVSEIVLEDNATLHRYKVVLEGDDGHHLATTKIVQGRDTNLNSFSVSLRGQTIRNDLNVVLNGEGGNADLNGLYLNDRNRLIDNALHVTHAAPRCRSRMKYKGVLDGTSKSVFTGKVLVPPDSQKTDSDQLNNNLLLSDDATIDTQPQLEIFADDVKCTHGATIGGFPPELTFYFQSRGMAADMANAILTYGFASEVGDRIPEEALRDRLANFVSNKYRPK